LSSSNKKSGKSSSMRSAVELLGFCRFPPILRLGSRFVERSFNTFGCAEVDASGFRRKGRRLTDGDNGALAVAEERGKESMSFYLFFRVYSPLLVGITNSSRVCMYALGTGSARANGNEFNFNHPKRKVFVEKMRRSFGSVCWRPAILNQDQEAGEYY
jgi:hypothetical protein